MQKFKKEYDANTGFPLWFPQKWRWKRKVSVYDIPWEWEKGHCRWCGDTLPPYRKTTCDECAKRVGLWTGRTVLPEVQDRDHGICAICGIDTEEIYRQWRLIEKRTCWKYYNRPYWHIQRETWGPWYIDSRFCMWDADHILPVTKGGGICDLRNYRTLCLKCHKGLRKKKKPR